ncbi:MAG: protein TolQ [Neisseriaceae bacterium]|nr:MAG: protein TolQ [Neisseriaceae bacterium]
MEQQMSIISLITDASLAVQAIMGLLAIFSVVSWGIIISKWIALSKAKSETVKFMSQYHNSNSITTLYNSISTAANRSTTCQMFYAGLSEYNRLSKSGISNKDTITTNIERSLTATIDDELNSYESRLSTLATFGSVSPYIGLLGTVWGIMHAFIGLGNTGQATLASVAPGIAEALIATAIGLFVAIPAYMGYNKFSADVEMLEKKMNRFGDEFLNLINRKLSATSNQDM